MDGNKTTMHYLADQKEMVRVKTEAMKAMTRRAVKKITKLVVIVLVLGAVALFALVKANAWWRVNEFIFALPVEVSYKTNEMVRTVKRVPSMVKVAITDDSLLEENIVVKDYGEIAKRTGNPEAALFTLGMFRGVKEGEVEVVATFMAESGFRNDAMGWNCIYYDNGKPYSGACAVQDRGQAWSVDCGIAQLNFKGTECPAEAFNPVWNITMARAKYDRQGIRAWVAYGNELFNKQLAMLTSE